jgi:hypothetical protein
MPIDYNALGQVLGTNSQDPLLGASEVDPQTGLTFSEEDVAKIQSRLTYGSPVETFPGAVDKSTLRVLGNEGYYPQQGDQYVKTQLAREQSSFGQFANAMNQAILGEIVGGTLEGVGYLLDTKQYADLINGEEQEFGNDLSDIGRALKTWTREVGPVYTDPNAKEFDPGNWAWWMKHMPSVASTLSLMIPAAGAVRGVSSLAKLAGIGKGMGKMSRWMTTGISQAVTSRHMENLMEASGVYEDIFKESKALGMSEEEAKRRAAVGASNTYNKQWAMLLQDIPQYLLLNRLGGMGPKNTTLKVAKAMGMDPGKTIATKSFTILRDMMGEGGEEMYQYLINEQSRSLARKSYDPKTKSSFTEIWKENYDSGEMWTSAVFGALGAGVMQAGFAGVNAKAIQTSNKMRIAELQGRGEIIKKAYEEYSDAKNSGDPIRERQALNNLGISMAINAEQVGNERNALETIDTLTNNPNDEVFERYNIDPQQGSILSENPEIAQSFRANIRRVKELKRVFEKENNLNKNIPQNKKDAFTGLMVWNQMMLEKTKIERAKLQEELNDLSSTSEKYNELTRTGREVRRIENELLSLRNPKAKIGSTERETKPGVIDMLNHKKKTLGDKMDDVEKLLHEQATLLNTLKHNRLKAELKEAKKNYTKEDKAKDKETVVSEEEIDNLLSAQNRLDWADTSIEHLNKQMEKYREGTPLVSKKDADEQTSADEDTYDEETDVEINDTVKYKDTEGNVHKGVVTDLSIAEVDGERKQTGQEGESSDNIIKIQPVNEKGEETGEEITMSGLDVTLDEKAKVEDDGGTTIDPISGEEQVELGLVDPFDEESANGTPNPIGNLSYSHREGGKIVIRNGKLHQVLNDPETSYAEAFSDFQWNPAEKVILERIKNGIKRQIKSLKEADPKLYKEVIKAHTKSIQYLNKLIQGERLTAAEIDAFIENNKNIPIGPDSYGAVDKLPISVGVTIEGTRHKDGLYMHAADFAYIKPPANIIRKSKKDPSVIDKYKLTKMEEARNIRATILRKILAGETLYTKGVDVQRGVPNTLSKDLSKDKRANNIAKTLGVKPNDIKLGITKARARNPYLSQMYTSESGEDTILGSEELLRFGGEGNMFVLTEKTINGDIYALKVNRANVHKEHAQIIYEAFKVVGRAGIKRKVSKTRAYQIKWPKGYERVTGIGPQETIDLLVAHGKELTDPNSKRFKNRLRSDKHKAALAGKTLYLDANREHAILKYGLNPETNSPFEINLVDPAEVAAKEKHFMEWMNDNKYYANHLSKNSLGLELNGGFLKSRPFTIGRVNKIERKKNDNYNGFLVKNNFITTDTTPLEDTGLIFHSPVLGISLIPTKEKINITEEKPAKTITEKIKKGKKKTGKQIVANTTVRLKKNADDSAKRSFGTDQIYWVKQVKGEDGAQNTKLVPIEDVDKKDPNVHAFSVSYTKKDLEKKFDVVGEAKPAEKTKTPKTVRVAMGKSNITKIAAGTKTTTIRGDKQFEEIGLPVGESSLVYYDGIPYKITNRGKLSVKEAGGKKKMLKSEGIKNEEEFKYQQTKDWIKGKGKLYIYDIEPIIEEEEADPLDEINGSDFFGTMPMEATTPDVDPERTIDIEKEKKWLKETLGIEEDEIETFDRLLKMSTDGRRAYSLYSHSSILLYEGAAEGALYHEAWHRVSLGYFTKAEREALYRVARNIYNMPDATNREIEERLAEEFREYVLLKEKEGAPKKHNAVVRFFNKIYEFIKRVFAGPTALKENDVTRMFKSVYMGEFKDSEVLPENINNIRPGEYAMAVDRHSFETIVGSKHRKDIVKKLTDQLLQLNDISDLNTFRKKQEIDESLLWTWLDSILARLEKKKDTYKSKKKSDIANQFYLVFSEVNLEENRPIFMDMISDYLNSIGVVQKYNETTDKIEVLEDEAEAGTIDVDKKSSWETSSKDNAMSSIKFLVHSLHESNKVDPMTGLLPYVDVNMVWSSLLLNLNSFDNIKDMISELKVLGHMMKDSPWFMELANKLENKKEDSQEIKDRKEMLRNQFLTTFNLWKHRFVTFEARNTDEGVDFTFVGNSENELSRSSTLRWNENFYLDDAIVRTTKKGFKKLNRDFFVELESDYEKLVNAVEEDFEAKNIEGKYLDKHINKLVDLLNRVHIGVDYKTIELYLERFYDNGTSMRRLLTMLDNEMKHVLGSDSPLYIEASQEKTEEEELEGPALTRVRLSFIRNGVIYKKDRKSLGLAYAKAHPELQENTVIGAEGNKYYTYSFNNLATDTVRRLKHDDDYLTEKRKLLNNTRSRVLKLLDENEEIREAFYLATFSSFKENVRDDRGRDFMNIVELEEYLTRFAAIEAEFLPLPIMADRKQFYFMTGIPTLKEVVKDIRVEGDRIELKYSKQALKLFYDYFLDEKERVIEANKLRDEYQNIKTTPERKAQIKENLILNYHYTGDLDLTEGNAYHFQHFKDFNKYSVKKLNKLKKADVLKEITRILNDNFKEEYEYAARIGAITRIGTRLKFATLNSERGRDLERLSDKSAAKAESDAVVDVLGNYMINNMMSIIESEKVFFADPAFFKKDDPTDPNNVDVVDDMYKRWFGVGSSGAEMATTTESDLDSFYNVITLNTQEFISKWYDAIYNKHLEIYKKAGIEEDEAKKRATATLRAYKKVDPSDGQMLISPEMYRSISNRLGLWTPEKQAAYELLMTDPEERTLTVEEEMGVVLQPLKTVYVGKHTVNNMDVVVYDKMSMATIFRRQVMGTPMEEVLDRMEAVGKYEGLEKVQGFKYDTTVKLGGRPGIDLFLDGDLRDNVNDLSDGIIERQFFQNLKHQVVTDPHDNILQTVASQTYKVITSNIEKDEEYGEYGTGEEMLESLTKTRMALRNA